MTGNRSARLRQSGVTLIEILVSVLVIAFGILTMATVQSNSMKYQKTSEYRSIATLLASDIADRMRANKSAIDANHSAYAWLTTSYSRGALTEGNRGLYNATCGTVDSAQVLTKCEAAEIAQRDLYEWKTRLLYSLPNASGHIAAYDPSQNAVDLWIAWVDPDEKNASGTSIAARSAECPDSATSQLWDKSDINYRCIFLRVAL
jgi:type IV pilus assembly protein PilV